MHQKAPPQQQLRKLVRRESECATCGAAFSYRVRQGVGGRRRLSCSPKCAEAHRQAYRRAYAPPTELRRCLMCELPFEVAENAGTVTCGRPCGLRLAAKTKAKARAERQRPSADCSICGAGFRVRYRGQMLCSPTCGQFADAQWRVL